METWKRLKVTRGEEGGELWWKEGEGTRQRTCMNDPQDMDNSVGLNCGTGVWDGQSGAKGKNWDNFIVME